MSKDEFLSAASNFYDKILAAEYLAKQTSKFCDDDIEITFKACRVATRDCFNLESR